MSQFIPSLSQHSISCKELSRKQLIVDSEINACNVIKIAVRLLVFKRIIRFILHFDKAFQEHPFNKLRVWLNQESIYHKSAYQHTRSYTKALNAVRKKKGKKRKYHKNVGKNVDNKILDWHVLLSI